MAANKNEINIIVLAGGQGARFWPLSRKARPKQFLNFGDKSLLSATVARVLDLVGGDSKAITVVTGESQKNLVKKDLPSAKIITEPIGRNTAASIGLAAITLNSDATNNDPVMVILPADHIVTNEDVFRQALSEGIQVATDKDVLVTIGVRPTSPQTGYGYIERGELVSGNTFSVKAFHEKPDTGKAKAYLDSGCFFWNSGMFVWRRSVFMAAVKRYMPDLLGGLEKISSATAKQKDTAVREVFDSLQSVPVDVGILERVSNCVMVLPDHFGWSDVGSIDSWGEHLPRDGNGNNMIGDVLPVGSKNCIVSADKSTVTLLGCEDLVVVESQGAILVCPRSRVQDVRQVVDELTKLGREELL